MRTNKNVRNERFVTWAFAIFVLHAILYSLHTISGNDFFLSMFGYGIVWAILSTLEFEDDDEEASEDYDTDLGPR